MLTMNCILKLKLHPDHLLTLSEKEEILNENMKNNYSYFCLLKEMLTFNVTIRDLLRGWSGIQLFDLSK